MRLAQKLEDEGFVQFDTDPNSSTADISSKIGETLYIDSINSIQLLSPKAKGNEPKNTYSGNFGLGAFPLHTDLAHWYVPPRYFLLRCISPSNKVATKLIKFKEVIKDESPIKIKRAHFKPRRRLENKSFILRVQQKQLYRWDSIYLKPANDDAIELQKRIKKRFSEVNTKKIYLSKKGMCILIDNWKILHGRESIPTTELSRKIERVYFKRLI